MRKANAFRDPSLHTRIIIRTSKGEAVEPPVFGTLTLSGLVTVPIKLYSAIGGVMPSLHLTHCEGGRVTQMYQCGVCNTAVMRADCGRAVKIGKQMIPLTANDLADDANGEPDEGEANGSFALIGFCASAPAQMHLGRPYYMSYDDAAPPTAFRLLMATMLERGLCGLIKYTTRKVLNHGILLPQPAGFFILHQLVLAEEIRDPAELTLPEKPLDQKALTQMRKLVADMTLKSLPLADIKDASAARMRALIEAKLAESMKKGSSGKDANKGKRSTR